MANLMLGYPNLIDSATLSGGSWEATLPLTNIQNRLLAIPAQSTDDANASTKFDIDLVSAQTVRAIAFIHNLSTAANYRIYGDDASNFATPNYDSGSLDVWPATFVEELEKSVRTTVHVLPSDQTLRYWRIEMDDTTNPDTVVRIGRAFIGPCWQPAANMSYGVSHRWEPRTDANEAISGAKYYHRNMPRLVAQFRLDWLTTNEAFHRAYELQRRAGLDEEVLWVYDPSDPDHAHRRRMLATMRELSSIEFPRKSHHRTAFELEQILP